MLRSTSAPRTTPELLRLLGIQDLSVVHQVPVLIAWLADNIASPELRLSLRANGYGYLLPQATELWRPWAGARKAS
jgi:hypothetical protein